MRSPFKSYDLRWLIGSALVTSDALNESYPSTDIVWFDYPIPESFGSGGFQSLKLSNGISLHHSYLRFSKQANGTSKPSAHVQMEFCEPTLMIQVVFSGRLSRQDLIFNQLVELGPASCKIDFGSRWDGIYTFETAPAPVEHFFLHAGLSSLNALIGPQLCAKLRSGAMPNAYSLKLPHSVIGPLRYCFDGRLQGALHKLHAQAKTLEFLENLIRYQDGQHKAHPLAKDKRASAAYNLIRELGPAVTKGEQIAHRLGVSTKTLNAAFIESYGMSISRFIKEQRLAIAHEHVLHSNKPLREICDLLGYSQIGNFSAAFKDFFGYSPSELRKDSDFS